MLIHALWSFYLIVFAAFFVRIKSTTFVFQMKTRYFRWQLDLYINPMKDASFPVTASKGLQKGHSGRRNAKPLSIVFGEAA